MKTVYLFSKVLSFFLAVKWCPHDCAHSLHALASIWRQLIASSILTGVLSPSFNLHPPPPRLPQLRMLTGSPLPSVPHLYQHVSSCLPTSTTVRLYGSSLIPIQHPFLYFSRCKTPGSILSTKINLNRPRSHKENLSRRPGSPHTPWIQEIETPQWFLLSRVF